MKTVMASNPTRDEVKRAAQAVLDAIDRVDIDLGGAWTSLKPVMPSLDSRKTVAPKAEKKEVKVLPREIRNMLTAGALMMKHSKTAAPRPRHVYVDNDLKFLIWKDPKDKGVLDEKNMMKVFKIKSLDRGRASPQLMRKNLLGKFLAKEECSFCIQGRERTVDLECDSEAQREKWIHAIETLLEYKKSLKSATTKMDFS